MCTERDCIAQKYVVFKTDVDLMAHRLEVHTNTAPRVDLYAPMEHGHRPSLEHGYRSLQALQAYGYENGYGNGPEDSQAKHSNDAGVTKTRRRNP